MEEIIATPSATNVADTTPKTIKVKYNHEEKEVSLDEAPILIQKGMNYDKVLEQLDTFKNDEALKIADKLAKKYNISRSDLLKKFESDIEAQAVADYAEKKGMTPEDAKELLDTKQENEALREEKTRLETEKETKERLDKEVTDFRKEYPDVKNEDIPDEVMAAWQKGVPLSTAYAAHENKTLKARIKALEEKEKVNQTNQENANSSMGSVSGTGSSQPTTFTVEQIEKMTPDQYEKLPKATRDEFWKQLYEGKLK